MDPITQQQALAAAGAAGAEALYVDDVFSTYLYDGTGTAQTITNGIDLSGEGGLVWIKARSEAYGHFLYDTERGANERLASNSSGAESTQTSELTSFNSTGFSLGTALGVNQSTPEYCSWTFRKAPGFFDVVTYTGTGSAQSVSHSLGSTPGCVIIKKTSGSQNWLVYHRSLSSGLGSNGSTTSVLHLNTTGSVGNQGAQGPTATASALNLSTNWENDNGATYVAYLFAHDDQSFGANGDEAIIKCGTITTDGSGYVEENLGFEPQWLMMKQTSGGGGDWLMFDVMRGFYVRSGPTRNLNANSNGAEGSYPYVFVTPNGFEIDESSLGSHTFVYIAIRRPHKPPEAGTDVFAIDTLGGTSPSPPGWTSGFPVDWEFIKKDNTTNNWESITRLTNKLLYLNLTNAESSINANDTFDHMTGWSDNTGPNVNNFSWMFRRAPGFFDVVTYTGTGANQTISHNLGVAPEFLIVKKRNGSAHWEVGSDGLTDWSYYVTLSDNLKAYSQSNVWNSTAPTSSVFSLGTNGGVNGSTGTYIAYLFATLPGISKVGSYTGTGSNIGVNCGFTAGARFVLIKRTDSTGDWYVYDSTRGIIGGNDPYLLINSTAAEVTNTDYIDPLNSGFTVTSSAPAALNASGGTYLFLAIA